MSFFPISVNEELEMVSFWDCRGLLPSKLVKAAEEQLLQQMPASEAVWHVAQYFQAYPIPFKNK